MINYAKDEDGRLIQELYSIVKLLNATDKFYIQEIPNGYSIQDSEKNANELVLQVIGNKFYWADYEACTCTIYYDLKSLVDDVTELLYE